MHKWATAVVRYYHPEQNQNIMTNEERWNAFIEELRAYIGEHHLGPSKHTSLRNQLVYYRRSFDRAQEPLSPEMAERKRQLDEVLGMRDLSIYTGGKNLGSKTE